MCVLVLVILVSGFQILLAQNSSAVSVLVVHPDCTQYSPYLVSKLYDADFLHEVWENTIRHFDNNLIADSEFSLAFVCPSNNDDIEYDEKEYTSVIHVNIKPDSYNTQGHIFEIIFNLDASDQYPSTECIHFIPKEGATVASTASGFIKTIDALLAFMKTPQKISQPLLVDTFAPVNMVGVDLPAKKTNIKPMSISGQGNGSMVVACGLVALAIDERWMFRNFPGKKLTDEGMVHVAWQTFMSSAGTTYLLGDDGPISFQDGAYEYQKPDMTYRVGDYFGLTSSGDPFTAVVEPPQVQLYRPQSTLILPLPFKGDTALSVRSGPEETFWFKSSNIVHGLSLYVMAADGAIIKKIALELPEHRGNFWLMQVLPDGGFIAKTDDGIHRFHPNGRMAWTWNGQLEGLEYEAKWMEGVYLNGSGLYYLYGRGIESIIRLAESGDVLDADMSFIAHTSATYRAEPSRVDLLLEIAQRYEKMGAFEASRLKYIDYLAKRPNDRKALASRKTLDDKLLHQKAESIERDAFVLLDAYGPETARQAYTKTMQVWESLLSTSSDVTEIKARIAGLRQRFVDAENSTVRTTAKLSVEDIELVSLFPALFQLYRSQPAGRIKVINTSSEPLKDLKAEVFIRKYMDFPSTGQNLSVLNSGAADFIDLNLMLNELVLDLQEDLPLQVQVTIHYTDSQGPQKLTLVHPTTLFRKTALSWDDSAKLASFITPNDETVASLAYRLISDLGDRQVLGRNILRAMSIVNGLGALPLIYVPDPFSPFTTAFGDEGLIDTVRFPRTTLLYKGGDCDDTTALLCSLLESIGIQTAIVTSPGHVFAAFNTGQKRDEIWKLGEPVLMTVEHNGTVWIPLESTVMSEGFIAAWRTASDLIRRYNSTDELEFLPVADQRERYLALPLPPSVLPVESFGVIAKNGLDQNSLTELDFLLYTPSVKMRTLRIAKLSGSALNRGMNSLAGLHQRFGHSDEAERVLVAIMEQDPSYIPAYLNLVTLHLQQGKSDRAQVLLSQAQVVAPGSESVKAYIVRLGLSGPTTSNNETSARGSTITLPPWEY